LPKTQRLFARSEERERERERERGSSCTKLLAKKHAKKETLCSLLKKPKKGE
jgi:hypothetical protein